MFLASGPNISEIKLQSTPQSGRIGLSVVNGLPKIRINDSNKYEMVLGSAELTTPRTGEAHSTSAASVVMFDNEGKVIWRAP